MYQLWLYFSFVCVGLSPTCDGPTVLFSSASQSLCSADVSGKCLSGNNSPERIKSSFKQL